MALIYGKTEAGASGYSGYSGASITGASGYSGYSGASVTGASGYSGKSGFSGVSGPTGAQGMFGGDSHEWKVDTALLGDPPTLISGNFGTGNSDPTAISVIAFSIYNNDSIDVSSWLYTLDGSSNPGTKGRLRFVIPDKSYLFVDYDILAITEIGSDYVTLSVQYVTGGAVTFSSGDTYVVSFCRAGDQGSTGLTGASGFSGYSGRSGFSGFSGASGFSGYSSASGFSGYSGTSGAKGGTGDSGFSGYSGRSGFSGYSAASGFSGYSAASGFSGYSGRSGFSGYSGLIAATEADLPPGLGLLGKWYQEANANQTGTSRSQAGGISTTTVGTLSNATDTSAPLIKILDSSPSFGAAGIYNSTSTTYQRLDHKIRAAVVFKTPLDTGGLDVPTIDFTDVRIVVGIWDVSTEAAYPCYGSHMSNTPGLAIVYDTDIPDTNWQAHSCDGGGGTDYTQVDTGVTVTANTLYRLVIVADASSAKFYLQTGLTGAMSLVATISTHLPSSSLPIVVACFAMQPNATAHRYIYWSKFSTLEG